MSKVAAAPAVVAGRQRESTMALHASSADLDIVRRINVFRGLAPLVIERLIGPASAIELDDGDILFRQDDPALAFFILVEGWVKLSRVTFAGDEAVIHVFTKGDSFAEAVAFTGKPYPATAQAVSVARVVSIPAAHVIKCIRDTPDIALGMIAATQVHLHHLVEQVEQLKAQTGVQRLADFLACLCPPASGAYTLALPYDKGLIAGRLGLEPETLSRSFVKLKQVGVEVKASHVAIADVERLRRFAADDHEPIRTAPPGSAKQG
jgi:CRP-like cAMP-binding protein